MIIILSAPSGCGKSSIAQKLLQNDPQLVLSVSATTRKPRIGEIEGQHYFFKTHEEFKTLNLLEAAQIYGNLYGTPQEYVETQLKKGKNVLFDIDYQGAKQIIDFFKNSTSAENLCAGSVRGSSCTLKYTPVLRSEFPINSLSEANFRRSLIKTAKAKIVSIFIIPPTIETLKVRLQQRNQDDPSTIEKRINEASKEMDNAVYYDHIVMNDDFEQAVLEIQEIILSQRNKKQ